MLDSQNSEEKYSVLASGKKEVRVRAVEARHRGRAGAGAVKEEGEVVTSRLRTGQTRAAPQDGVRVAPRQTGAAERR